MYYEDGVLLWWHHEGKNLKFYIALVFGVFLKKIFNIQVSLILTKFLKAILQYGGKLFTYVSTDKIIQLTKFIVKTIEAWQMNWCLKPWCIHQLPNFSFKFGAYLIDMSIEHSHIKRSVNWLVLSFLNRLIFFLIPKGNLHCESCNMYSGKGKRQEGAIIFLIIFF